MNQHEQRIANLIAEDPAVRQQIVKTIEARRRREAAAREALRERNALERMLAVEAPEGSESRPGRRRRAGETVALNLLVRHAGLVDVLSIDGDGDGDLSVMIDDYESSSMVEIQL